MATFLRDRTVLQASVIAIQEPWKNEYDDTTHQPARLTHQLLHPKATNDQRARVALYINKKIDPAKWTHTAISPDYQILHLRHLRGEQTHDLYIHNIYNDPKSSTFELLDRELTRIGHSPMIEHLVLGDMNVHHPAWGGPGTKIDKEGTELLEIADRHELELATEEGLITWERGQSKSTIDLTFLSISLFHRLILIERADTVQHDSDHWPIRTQIDINTPINEPPKRRNWKTVDMKLLTETLQRDLVVPDLTTASKAHIELATVTFTSTIRHAIEKAVPWANPSAWSNPDFTPECREAIKTCRCLRRIHSNTHNPWIWRAYLRARNVKKRLVSKSLKLGHRRRVQQATEKGPQGLWRLAKWARTRRGLYESGITPTLTANDRTAETVEEKTALLSETFFPAIPEADLTDIEHATYPEQLPFPEILRHEIEQVIHSTPPDKAPGEDGIPNSFWHLIISISTVLDTLYQIYNACIRTGYNPSHFQRSITVVLRKGGTDRDYRMPKAYRPVALLNTLGKFLEAIIARRISYMMETEGLLPRGHLGGRKGISTDHAIQIILERIRRAWGDGLDVVSMLLLDVSGAYDNAHHSRLLHNMQKRRLGHLVPWVAAFLTGRSTRIKIPEGMSERIPTPTGIPQGSPISPILYLIYNSDLIEDCADEANHVSTSGWVDDVGIMAAGHTEAETIEKLQRASATADQWALRHASVFDKKKYQLIHFVNPQSEYALNSQSTNQSITLQDGTSKEASPAVKYLGIWLDSGLTFTTHRDQAVAKGGQSLEALRGLAGSTWGVALGSMRRIYQAIVIPQMLYGAAAWYQPGVMTQKQLTKITHEFANVQKRAACLISGAFRTTAAEALNTELFLMPIRHQLDQLVKATAVRIRTGPTHAIPPGMLIRRTDPQLTLGGYTPMEAHAWKKGGCLEAPLRTLAGDWESREAYVQAPWREPPPVVIDEREKAVTVHNRMVKENERVLIYTDGSGYQGYIGASMVIPQFQRQHVECIGMEDTSTVYAAEACGIKFALTTLLRFAEDHARFRKAAIFSDSQAALQSIQNPRMVSGQSYIRDCVNLYWECIENGIQVDIRWIPGHEGVPGNEAADRAAKRAALTGARQQNETTNWIILGAAAKRRIRCEAKKAWEKAWGKQKSGKPTRKLIPKPSRGNLQYWAYLRKATSSILIQIRTERVALGHYLWRINRRANPYCDCGLSSQTVKHVLLDCPIHADERDLMWTRIKGLRRTTDMRALLSEKSAAVAIAQFVIDTGMLAQFHNADPEAMGTYEEPTEQQDTNLGTRINAHAGDVSPRSARSSIRTSNNTNTSLGSIRIEPVDGDVLEDEDESVNVQIGEDSHVGDERRSGRVRAIDMWV